MYNPDNVFAKIVDDRLPCDKVYEDDVVIAFRDMHPVAPIHVLVVPKKGYTDYTHFINEAAPEDVVHYFRAIVKIVQLLELKEDSYRLITNKGALAGQTVFHFHTHIIGGNQIGGLIG